MYNSTLPPIGHISKAKNEVTSNFTVETFWYLCKTTVMFTVVTGRRLLTDDQWYITGNTR